MAGSGVIVRLNGIDDLKRALQQLPEKLRRKALIKPMRKAMKAVLEAARQAVPVMGATTPYRTAGTVKRALTVRTSKVARQAGNVGVFVNVRPLKAAQIRKAKAKGLTVSVMDPFYWRFLEFGTKKMTARPFMTPAASKLQEALVIFEREAVPAIEALNKPGK